jgi:glutamine cyclotransferase
MRLLVSLTLVLILVLVTSCGGPGSPGSPNGPAERARESPEMDSMTFPQDSPVSIAGFGADSLWVTDLGDYRCDDTPRVEASCSGPEKVLLRRLNPETREAVATLPLGGTEGVRLAFGAGDAWISYDNYLRPSESGVLRLDLETNEITHKTPVKAPSGLAFGEGSVWVTSLTGGTVSRVDPDTNEVVEEIQVSGGGTNDVAVGEGSVWVASWGSPDNGSRLSEEDYERGTRPEPLEDAKLVRIDLENGRVVAEIPVENRAIEGGASSVAVGDDAIWVTSVNGKLLRVDPETNETVAKMDVGDYCFKVETGAGAVWTMSEVNVNDADADTDRLTRIDPETNRASGSLNIKGAGGLALEDGAVWLSTSSIERGEGKLVRIQP